MEAADRRAAVTESVAELVGGVTTNGDGVIWFVVGGDTLWRTTTAGAPWRLVYRTLAGTTDNLYPVLFASRSDGFMAESEAAASGC